MAKPGTRQENAQPSPSTPVQAEHEFDQKDMDPEELADFEEGIVHGDERKPTVPPVPPPD